jgi:hypothetical protein
VRNFFAREQTGAKMMFARNQKKLRQDYFSILRHCKQPFSSLRA